MEAQEELSIHITLTAVDGNNVPIPNGGTTSSNVIKFTITPTFIPPSGFSDVLAHCLLDEHPFSVCGFNLEFTGLAPGQHRLDSVVTARFGHFSVTSNNEHFSWTITSTPPLTPIQATQQLIQLKQSMHLATTPDRELDAQLNAIILLFQHNLNAEACGHLAAFTIVVQSFSQSGLLTETQASQLLQGAHATMVS